MPHGSLTILAIGQIGVQAVQSCSRIFQLHIAAVILQQLLGKAVQCLSVHLGKLGGLELSTQLPVDFLQLGVLLQQIVLLLQGVHGVEPGNDTLLGYFSSFEVGVNVVQNAFGPGSFVIFQTTHVIAVLVAEIDRYFSIQRSEELAQFCLLGCVWCLGDVNAIRLQTNVAQVHKLNHSVRVTMILRQEIKHLCHFSVVVNTVALSATEV